MIVGDPAVFAIESEISYAYDRLSSRALGFFVIYIAGRCYGVREWDATLLAVSFDEVGRRIARRGSHNPSFGMDADAADIAYSFRRVVYGEPKVGEQFLGMSATKFSDSLRSNDLVWAPDGDEAFDDGSYVLQFEDEQQVRLVAFKSLDMLYDPASLREVLLSQDDFYGILKEWHGRFNNEWISLPKMTGPIQ